MIIEFGLTKFGSGYTDFIFTFSKKIDTKLFDLE